MDKLMHMYGVFRNSVVADVKSVNILFHVL